MIKSYSVVIEKNAYEDLKDIFSYIAQDSPLIATEILQELEERINSLQNFPERCPVILEIHHIPIHCLIFKESFKILYSIQDNRVHILHCMRSEKNIAEDIF